MRKPKRKQPRPTREGKKILSRLRTIMQDIQAFETWQKENGGEKNSPLKFQTKPQI